jgi:hypothetical protein
MITPNRSVNHADTEATMTKRISAGLIKYLTENVVIAAVVSAKIPTTNPAKARGAEDR